LLRDSIRDDELRISWEIASQAPLDLDYDESNRTETE